VSRRCRSCEAPFRPDAKWQRVCWDCWRRLQQYATTIDAREESTMTDIETIGIVETTGEIVPYEPPATAITMYGVNDPAVALQQIATISGLFVDVARDRGLVDKIQGKEYVSAGGCDVLAGLTGLAPYVVWVHETEDGYHARVEVRRVVNGTTIAAAEQICSRTESKWARAEKHTLAGMAQTRARRRALASVLAPIIELAGYQPGEPPTDVGPESRAPEPVVPKPSRQQGARLRELIAQAEERDPSRDWRAVVVEVVGCPFDKWTPAVCEMAIEALEKVLAKADSEAAA
jgi:hypothetical protein